MMSTNDLINLLAKEYGSVADCYRVMSEATDALEFYDKRCRWLNGQRDALIAEIGRLRDAFERIHAVSNLPDHDCRSICVEILDPSPQQQVGAP